MVIAIDVQRRRHLLVGTLTCKVVHVSFPNLLCMLQMTSSRTSSIMAEKNQNGRFIVIFRSSRKKNDLVGVITSKKIFM